MKIIQFIASKDRGGAESMVANLSNAMFNNKMDIELLLLSNSQLADQLDVRIPITFLHFNSRFNPLLYLEILWFLIHKKPNIIHTHSAKATELIYTIRHFISALHIATKHNARKGNIFNKIKHVTAVSREVQKSIFPNSATIIYNGIEPKSITPITHPQRPFQLYAIGRLDKIKAYDLLIQACAKLSCDFRLHIVGEGKEREALENLVYTLEMIDKVIFEGFQTDIASIMNQSDLVVICSHSEGFSIVMVEALFYAPLLISTRVSGAIEILDEFFLIEHETMQQKIEDIFKEYETYQSQFDLLKLKYQNSLKLEKIVLQYKTYYDTMLKQTMLKE